MSFRIHTQSPELKHELERKLARFEGQLDGDFEYEISAEVLPAEHALNRAGSLAAETGADSIFVAAGTFAKKEVEIPEPVLEERAAIEPLPEPASSPVTHELREQRQPLFDAQKIQHALAEKSARARELSGELAARTGSFMKSAGASSANGIKRTSKWLSERGAEARVAGAELRKRFAEKAEQSRQQAADWNARRVERQVADEKLRAERERAAHREAELAAAAAHIMHREEKKKEAEQTPIKQKVRVATPPKVNSTAERDNWPIWRNAFAVAACLAMIGIFLLAAGGNQSKASPATSTELAKPAVVVPEHFAQQPKPAAAKAVAAPASVSLSKPTPHKRVARTDANDGFEEVTVRHYPFASPLAPPKKDAKGVVQISDME